MTDQLNIIKFKRLNEIGIFEVGFKSLDSRCKYIYTDGHIMNIIAYRYEDREGFDYCSVKATDNNWYNINGVTKLARLIKTYKNN